MGIGGMSIWQLLIILVIVLLLFGTKRLKGLGGDLGGAIKGFKKAMAEETDKESDANADADAEQKKVAEEPKPAGDAPHEQHEEKSETKQS